MAITHFGQFGTNDFIEYWTAFRLFISQQNPYDPNLMLELQRQQGRSAATPLMMWNPPWLMIVLWPILQFDFSTAANLWIYFNILLLAGVIFFSLDLLRERIPMYLATLVSIPLITTYLPLYDSFRVGQLGVFLAFVLIGGIWAIERNKWSTAGFFISLWTIKIHLFIPLAIFIFFRSLRNKKFLNPIMFSCGWLIVLSLITKTFNINAITNWVDGMQGKTAAGVVESVDQWIGASLTGGLRLLLEQNGLVPIWPIIVMPGIAAILSALTAIYFGSKIEFFDSAILMTILGILLAPFGWLFDLTAMLPIYIMALASCLFDAIPRSTSTATIGVLLISQATAWLQYGYSSLFGQHHFLWLPTVLVVGIALWMNERIRLGNILQPSISRVTEQTIKN